jgi:hypothetical protein
MGVIVQYLRLLWILAITSTFNGHARFSHTNVTKDKELTVFMAITSAPWYHHLRDAARDTWLLPCRSSPFCDYRFFVDKVLENVDTVIAEATRLKKLTPRNELGQYNKSLQANITVALAEEQIEQQDLVFRASWCRYMIDRHDEKLNYGTVFKKPWVYGGGGVKYYNLRGMYKVDWKICFTHFAKQNYPMMPLYHVYVEDDFFVCTENLLHQMTILRNLSPQKRPAFRTGWPLWDGFDDSSTIMSREIAQVFADHYPSDDLNCKGL